MSEETDKATIDAGTPATPKELVTTLLRLLAEVELSVAKLRMDLRRATAYCRLGESKRAGDILDRALEEAQDL